MSRRRQFIEYIESFWGRVDRTDTCWLWTGELNSMGYGFFKIYEGHAREKILAHRFSAIMAGMPVKGPRDVVMHTCDTPRCVRPEHLSVGTQTDNMRDARNKDRIDLAGLYALTRISCAECGAMFDGTPNRRYCDPCRQAETGLQRWRRKSKDTQGRTA